MSLEKGEGGKAPEMKETYSEAEEAFDRWLVKYDIPNDALTALEAIHLIRGAGGVAVLAHPGIASMSLAAIAPDFDEQVKILADLKIEGLGGVEVYRYDHTSEDQQRYLDAAQSLTVTAQR